MVLLRKRADIFSPTKRSEVMSKIHSSGTKLERDFVLVLQKSVRRRFRVNVADIKGKPDVVFDRARVCIFLDSDFWHGWQYPRWRHLLRNHFWRNKIENTRGRDRRITKHLRYKGWTVVRIREYQIRQNLDQCIQNIRNCLTQS